MVFEYLAKFAQSLPAYQEKVAAVHDSEAHAALRRLDSLEKSKPTASQLGRYAAIGGGGAVAGTVLKDVISKGTKEVLGGPGKRLRTGAANAISGALLSGAVPLVRSHMDQSAEKATLRKYLAQSEQRQRVTPPLQPKVAGWVSYVKQAAGAPTRGGFLMSSEVPPFKSPNVYQPVHKTAKVAESEKTGGATTPAGRLASSRRVGLPKVTAPAGPSVADTVPTFGQRLPGANKTTIGKVAPPAV